MKNKKANIEIVLLVVLVLLVTSATLFSFITSSGKVIAKISNVKFIEQFYVKQNLAEVYLQQSGENSIVKTYKEFAENNNYVGGSAIFNSKGQIEFEELHDKLNENFKNKFIENFVFEFKKYNFEDEEEYLQNLKELVGHYDFDVFVDKEILTINVRNLEIKDSYENIEVNYVPKILLSFNFTQLGLQSFNDIYNVKQECKSKEDMETCFENGLINFNVEVGENDFVNLKSKKDFLIDDGLKKIEFGFVVK